MQRENLSPEPEDLQVGKIQFHSDKDLTPEEQARQLAREGQAEDARERFGGVVGESESTERPREEFSEEEQKAILHLAKSMLNEFAPGILPTRKTVTEATSNVYKKDLRHAAFDYLERENLIEPHPDHPEARVLTLKGKQMLLENNWSRLKRMHEDNRKYHQGYGKPFNEEVHKRRIEGLLDDLIKNYNLREAKDALEAEGHKLDWD